MIESSVAESELSKVSLSLKHAVDLKRVLSNLINNAIEAYSATQEQKVIVYLKGHSILVQDHGKGMSSDVSSKLFSPGASFGKEHSAQAGSGLGLYGAKKFMESIGGEILIESTPGLGTTMILDFSATGLLQR